MFDFSVERLGTSKLTGQQNVRVSMTADDLNLIYRALCDYEPASSDAEYSRMKLIIAELARSW